MARIAILGGTGYAGQHIAQEAVSRGHAVRAWSRNPAATPVEGVLYETGSATDAVVLERALDGADVVVGSLSPRGDMAARVRGAYSELAIAADERGVRLLVVGGAGSLLTHEGGSRLLDGDFPDEYRAEAEELAAVLDDLQSSDASLDWTYVSPAAVFGSFAEGERTGAYRSGGDVLVTDEAGNSVIGGADFAMAVVDEIESPTHVRSRFTVAY